MTQEQVKDLLPAYALGALSAVEQKNVKSFLAANPALHGELDVWQELVASFAFAVEPLEPSPELRARLLERVRQTESTPETARPALKSVPVSNVVQMPARATAPVAASPSRWLALAAAIALGALLLSLFIVWRKNQSLQGENRDLAQQLQLSDHALTDERAWHQSLLGPDGRGVVLQGTPVAPTARAHLSYNVKNGQAWLSIRELPPAPTGKSYQIWFTAKGQTVPGKVFNTGATGEANFNLQVPENGLNADNFAVTLELQPGANAPTGEKYLAAALS